MTRAQAWWTTVSLAVAWAWLPLAVGADGLAATSWRLVEFRGGDESALAPAPPDRDRYTVTFESGGSVSVRFDCNRGRGTWRIPNAGQVAFGPVGLTRMACAPGSLHDRLARQWTAVRSYVIHEGRLHLALADDAGAYVFEAHTRVTGMAVGDGAGGIPAGAQLEVTLEDVSRNSMRTDVIGVTRIRAPGAFPVPFEVAYDASRIDARLRYVLRARAIVAGSVILESERAPVLTEGAGPAATLVLRPALPPQNRWHWPWPWDQPAGPGS